MECQPVDLVLFPFSVHAETVLDRAIAADEACGRCSLFCACAGVRERTISPSVVDDVQRQAYGG